MCSDFHQELNSFLHSLDDFDCRVLRDAMAVLYTRLFQLRPSTQILRQRPIPEATGFACATDAEVLRRLEREMVRDGRGDLQSVHERALVQWFLEELLEGYQLHRQRKEAGGPFAAAGAAQREEQHVAGANGREEPPESEIGDVDDDSPLKPSSSLASVSCCA